MAFNTSAVFSSFFKDVLGARTNAWNLGSDSFKLALYNNTPVVATFEDDTLAHNTYNGAGGQWVTANEITGTNWAAGGIALVSPTLTIQAGLGGEVTWSVNNTSTASVTISTAFYGCLIYDTTVVGTVNGAVCAVQFGGSFTVGGGTLAINWGNDGHSNACVFYITD